MTHRPSAKRIWIRSLRCSFSAVLVVLPLVFTFEFLVQLAAYRPIIVLLFVLALGAFPLLLVAIQSKGRKTCLNNPMSWTGVIGLALYFSVLPGSHWVVTRIAQLCNSTGSFPFGTGQDRFIIVVHGTGNAVSYGYLKVRRPNTASLRVNFEAMTAVPSGKRQTTMPLQTAIEEYVRRMTTTSGSAQRISEKIIDTVDEMRTENGFKKLLTTGQITLRPIFFFVLVFALPVWYAGVLVFCYVFVSWRLNCEN